MYELFCNGEAVSVELRIDGDPNEPAGNEWAVLKVLDEAALIEIIQLRSGGTEAEVRKFLESFHPASAGLVV